MSTHATVTVSGTIPDYPRDEKQVTLRSLVLRYPEYLDVPITFWVSDDCNGYESVTARTGWVSRSQPATRADDSKDPGMFRLNVDLERRRLRRKPGEEF